MGEIKTDDGLLRALSEAAKRKPNQEQAHRQRVSYIMSSLGRNSGVTREKVERVLAAQEERK
jgi:hypothetical protein